jgi:voltage-gated potassium channel
VDPEEGNGAAADDSRDLTPAEVGRWDDRYGLLFLIIVASMLLTAANTKWLKVVAVVVQGVMVLFALYASRADRRVWRAALILIPIGVVMGIAGRLNDERPAQLTAALLNVVLPIAAIGALGRRIVKDATVTGRTILGLLSVYLLVGMTFSALFITIAVASQEPFFVQTKHADPVDFTYFSFVTLATVGYGDFTAANPVPRLLAALEGLTGQLYLVTVVAVAVSRVRPRGNRLPDP